MKVEGTRTFAAPRETVWEVLNDPARMAQTMPGVESFDIQDDRHWKANVKIPLGLGGLPMSVNFEKTEERRPEFARLHAKGTGVGALMEMTTEFQLSDEGGGTAMRWQADVRIAGPVGSMGQRVLQPIVNQQVKSVLNALDAQVMAAAGEAGGARPAGMAADPAAARETAPVESGGGGAAGGPVSTAEAPSPETDPELKDVGPPAPVTPEADAGAGEEGASGAEEGLSPMDEEAYSSEPAAPSRPDEDRPTREAQ